MTRAMRLAIACAAVLIAWAGQVQAAVLTNGALTVTIRDDNGAIDAAVFGGADYFNPGVPISDFGLQNNTNTATFVRNTTTGVEQQPVAVAGTTASGTFTGGGANVAFERTYSLVPGVDVLRITTVFTNNGADVTLAYFDTFDPDQGQPLGQGFGTHNDVFSLAGGTVGQARINSGGFQHTVIAGSLDSEVTVASGSPFEISSGTVLNNFFATPFDGNDAFSDSGTHIGLRDLIGAGASRTFTFDLAFGLTPSAAQAAFVQANANAIGVIPEPASIVLFGLGACATGVGAVRRRHKKQAT